MARLKLRELISVNDTVVRDDASEVFYMSVASQLIEKRNKCHYSLISLASQRVLLYVILSGF